MAGFLTVLGLSLASMVLSMVLSFILSLFTSYRLIHIVKTVLVSGSIAWVYTTPLSAGFFIVLTSVIWLPVIIGVVLGLIIGYLGQRGYLGNKLKWLLTMEKDEKLNEAIGNLSEEDVEEASKVAYSKESFREELIKRALDKESNHVE